MFGNYPRPIERAGLPPGGPAPRRGRRTLLGWGVLIAAGWLGTVAHGATDPVAAVVFIDADLPDRQSSVGTGFFVDPARIVTCYHVVRGATHLVVYDSNPTGAQKYDSDKGE